MPQTSINLFQDSNYEGMLGTTNIRVIRGAVEKFVSDVFIPYGRVVVRKTPTSSRLILPSAAGQKPIGIAIATDMYGYPESQIISGAVVPGYPPGVSINILTMGDFVGWTEEAVNVDDAALFRHTAAAAPKDIVGRFAKTVGATLDVYPGLRFLESRTTAGKILMALSLP